MEVHISIPRRSLSKRLQLRKWVDSKSFPRDDYFKSVDHARAIISRRLQGADLEAIEGEFVAGTIARLLEMEGALYDFLSDIDVSDEGVWKEICLVTALIVIERYTQAVERREWEPE